MGIFPYAQAQEVVTTFDLNGADGTLYNDENRGADFPGGDRSSLEIRYWDEVRFRASMVRFDVNAVNSSPDGAVLGLYPTSAGSMGADSLTFTIYGLTNESEDNWDEGSFSYNEAPGFEAAANGTYAINEDLDSLTTITVYNNLTDTYLYSEPSAELDAFINSDTNGLVTFAIVKTYSTESGSYVISPKEAGESVAPKLVYQSENGEPVLPNTEPSITLDSPTDGASYESNNTLTASASASDSDGEIASVSFYLDDTEIGSVNASPFEYEIDLSMYALGSHEFYAIAEDNDGAVASSDTVMFEITEAIGGSDAEMVTTFELNGADAAIYNDDNRGADYTGGNRSDLEIRYWEEVRFRASILRFDVSNVSSTPNGAVIGFNPTYAGKMGAESLTYTIYGMTDESQDNWDEGSVNYSSAPGFESAANGTYALTENMDSLTTITVYADSTGAFLYSDPSTELDAFINNDSNGLVTFAIIKTISTNSDYYAMNSKEAGVSVAPRLVYQSENGEPVLPNFEPSITLNSPEEGMVYQSDSTLTARATAIDSDGEIASVSFYMDGTAVANVTSSPYESEIDLSMYASGSYEFYAIAEDDDGATASSDTVTIDIVGGSGAGSSEMVTTFDSNGADVTLFNDENRAGSFTGGDRTDLEVRYWEAVRFRASMLRFDVSSVSAAPDGAVIGINPTYAENMSDETLSFTIFGLTNEAEDEWDEGSISYNSAPGFESAINGSYAINDDLDSLTTITVYADSTGTFLYSEPSDKLDAFIRNDNNGLVTFAIIRTYSNNSDIYAMSSKEAGELVAPRLVYKSENGVPVIPNLEPNITLSRPADGVSYESNSMLTALASASDPDGEIANVSFYMDGNEIGSATSSPYEYEIDLSIYELGSYEFFAIAEDDDGALASSDTVTFEIIEGNGGGSELPARVMEDIDRGLIAIDRGDDIYLSWRLLGKEAPDLGFNIYRDGTLVNSEPITDRTNYVDADGSADANYSVIPVEDGTELSESEATASVWANSFIDIPLNIPADGTHGGSYSPNDMSIGDLDGDNEYELVLKWYPSNAKDNAQDGLTDQTILEGLELDGTSMWRIELGDNIRSGAHYTQFIVYDFDSDGKAEVALKTAPGTRDGEGNYLSTGPAADDDDAASYVTNTGRIIYPSPEYLTIFEGATGKELQTELYSPQYDFKNNPENFWGDGYGNRSERYLAAVGYFNGESPSLVMSRGYYEGYVVAAWDWDGENLTNRWNFEAGPWSSDPYGGQGNHNIAVGDVDEDGKDEIMFGSAAIDDDGTGLYTTRNGHGDAGHLGDLDPDIPGLEFFMPHEWSGPGLSFRNAGTGSMIWEVPSDDDVGRGVAEDISAEYRGAEAWGLGAYNAKGDPIDLSPPSANFVIYWDGDVTRELLDRNYIDDMENGRIFTADGFSSNNGTKATPNLSVDLFGDWREEVIFRSDDNTSLRIFTTSDTSDVRRYTLMHDPLYRISIAWQNVAYNQPPHVGYYMPDGSPQPNIIYPDEYVSVSINPEGKDGSVIKDYKLQNYPNPFNPTTNISFSLPVSGDVKLEVFDINGRLISTIVNERMTSGTYSRTFDASNLASGIYFYRLRTSDYTQVKKMMLIK
ncbi:Por secretion system C-terminal sorting domain-containing protein [Gracilimonas mengyeensis]|uniref:Por secretion system C-terminal sorting domain-containing protein n=2 Tax=Gracilimonas mengyeensis TaxID=1302730 RepID=A0A521C384_9BACT|nr:Por secretion system C-terminal sorting domain-containing protein [Gracilimonas mengyeensis]